MRVGDRTHGAGAAPDHASRAPQSSDETFVWPKEREYPDLSFPSAAEAVSFLREHLAIEVAIPTSLPSTVSLDVATTVYPATEEGVRSAQVQLRTEQGDSWGIMYGRSGLDGCESTDAVAVRVSGHPALLRITADPGGTRRTWVQLVWPATRRHPDGVYGLFGWLEPRAVLAMAESMPVLSPPPAATASGC